MTGSSSASWLSWLRLNLTVSYFLAWCLNQQTKLASLWLVFEVEAVTESPPLYGHDSGAWQLAQSYNSCSIGHIVTIGNLHWQFLTTKIKWASQLEAANDDHMAVGPATVQDSQQLGLPNCPCKSV